MNCRFHVQLWLYAAVAVLALAGCSSGPRQRQPSERQIAAQALFEERCKTAGEKIYKRIEGVEGIFLIKIRPKEVNFGDQFKLDDPFGSDVGGEGYILSFLRGFYLNLEGYDPHGVKVEQARKSAYLYPDGYGYVEAIDPNDGQLYRYSGARKVVRRADINAPSVRIDLERNPKADLNVYTFILERTPIHARTTRFGVTYDDISMHRDREYWIAGSSLRIVDLQTNEMIAERVGYMVDWAQGSQVGNRSPWLLATRNACPKSFGWPSGQPAAHSNAQFGQTVRFASKVLISKGGE